MSEIVEVKEVEKPNKVVLAISDKIPFTSGNIEEFQKTVQPWNFILKANSTR